MKRLRFYLPGTLLILTAVFIMAFPVILAAMASALILIAGFFALAVGHGIQQSETKLNKMDERFRTSGWHRYCSFRSNQMM
jgi:hypothetical protein